ncbi:MAG: nuclear transport factor 2 family protein [Oscillospiraceae bacterium]|nr:nuclear transport factor 2 family protein [Oscillospiraceae bacterium]
MKEREQKIRAWFQMWLDGSDTGAEELFDPGAVYIESWGPEYHGLAKIRHWFREWNTRGHVLQWDIKQFFHNGDQTVVEWYFRNRMDDGREETFDGMSLVRWTAEEKICFLQEFGCNRNRYDPYENGPEPQFRDEQAMWF